MPSGDVLPEPRQAGGHAGGRASGSGWSRQAPVQRDGAAVLFSGSVDRVDFRAENGTSDDKGSAILKHVHPNQRSQACGTKLQALITTNTSSYQTFPVQHAVTCGARADTAGQTDRCAMVVRGSCTPCAVVYGTGTRRVSRNMAWTAQSPWEPGVADSHQLFHACHAGPLGVSGTVTALGHTPSHRDPAQLRDHWNHTRKTVSV